MPALRLAAFLVAALAASAIALAPAFAADAKAPAAAPAERPSCLGKARLRGELFEKGSSSVKSDVLPVLDVVAAAMKERCAGKAILIEGHTQDSGDAAADQAISEARAAEVKRLLVERGVPGSQLRTQGFGSTRPLTRDPALERLNRRVTFVVEGE